jgi:hypothetical protein
LPTGTQVERLQATGTDGKMVAGKVAGNSDIGCKRLTIVDGSERPEGADGVRRKSLKLQAVGDGCERLIMGDKEEAPPGFEPGMADLQSTALPLG